MWPDRVSNLGLLALEALRTRPGILDGKRQQNTVNSLYNDIHIKSKICYNVNLVCTKISGSCFFSLIFPFYSSRKHTFCVFVRIASPKRF